MSDWYQRRFSRQQPPRDRPPPGYIPQPPEEQQYIRFQRQGQEIAPPSGATNIRNFWDMMLLWRGGKAHKIDAEPCPQCGSPNYYSRVGEGPRRGPPPAPHCFACGYNGLFDQGMASTWQA